MQSSIPLAAAKQKELIVFDLDGTLAESKSSMDLEMSRLLHRLLEKKRVAVIGGGSYAQFTKQFLKGLRGSREHFDRLFLFPTTATTLYRYRDGWKRVYIHELPKSVRERIIRAFEQVFAETGYRHPEKTYGKVIEDRGTQVTFSALGQDVVALIGKAKGVRLKNEWKKKNTRVKLKMARLLAKHLKDLEVHAAGYTSIDVTAKGIDKAYGIRQIRDYLKVPIRNMLFVGDALFPGGNDYAVVKTGVAYVKVKGPEDTKRLIRTII